MDVNKVIHGKALESVKLMDDKSINCVITSPPYWQLRDYGWDGQWGMEPTYQMYLKNLWSLMDEIWRVLKDDGTVWINLGDTYNNTKKGNTNGAKGSTYVGTPHGENKTIDKRLQDEPEKSLLLIPHRFAIGCIHRGYILRNDIIWAKSNAMPESVTDRFSKKHEYFFLMTKNQKYYFDLDGIRDKPTTPQRMRNKASENSANGYINPIGKGTRPIQHLNGKNPGTVSDFWDIPTNGKKNNHFGTYNNALIEKPIIAGCPKGGVILDPFCGTGTTLTRALQMGRNVIGIEGKEEYCKMAEQSISINYSPLNFI